MQTDPFIWSPSMLVNYLYVFIGDEGMQTDPNMWSQNM